MELTKTRFKMTEVGLIPENWDIKLLKDVGKFFKGKGIRKNEVSSNGLKCIRYGELYTLYDNVIHRPKSCIPKDLACSSFRLHLGDVLFAGSGETRDEIGKSAAFVSSEETYAGGDIIILRGHGMIPHFLGYLLNSKFIAKEKSLRGQGDAVVHLYSSGLKDISIPIPTLTEQRAIATALSDVDELLANLEKLIEKKKAIKQGAMQQLFLGQIRLINSNRIQSKKASSLGSIPTDWMDGKFEDFFTGFSSGMTPFRGNPEYYKGNIPWITSGELNYNIITNTNEKITPEAIVKTGLKLLPLGTFLMAITGLEAAGTRGSCAITGVAATTNQSCMALYPIMGKSITEYLYHFYVCYGNRLALEYCQGTKQQSYTGRIARILPITIPSSTDEQRAIATVLTDLDLQIEKLEAKRKKFSNIKQGMMQELLTGRTRLI